MSGRQARTNSGPGSSASTTSNCPGHDAAAASNPPDSDQETTKETMDTDDQYSKTELGSTGDLADDSPSSDEVIQVESASGDESEHCEASKRDDDEAKNGQWQLALSLRERKRLRRQTRTMEDSRQVSGFEQAGSLGTAKRKINDIASVGDETRREREKNASGSFGTPGLAHGSRHDALGAMRGRRRSRATPLPKNDMKIIIRPKPGLVVRDLKTYEVARAIERACGDAETCRGDKFLLRLQNGSNIIIASTPHEQVAEKILKIKALDLNNTRHLVNTYISTPEGFVKGVVHGLQRETPEEELLNNLRVRTQGVKIVQARMLGKSETAMITFDGPIVPRFVYYYGVTIDLKTHQKTTSVFPSVHYAAGLIQRRQKNAPRGSSGSPNEANNSNSSLGPKTDNDPKESLSADGSVAKERTWI
ncbi:hypothetical protein MTO96_051988 [Rhipicephalus appendiculatus]